MVPDRLAIIPRLSIRSLGNLARQLNLPRNHGLGEITLANEIGDDVNVFDCLRIKKRKRVAQTRFLFPKRALNIGKNISSPNFGRMRVCRRTRIRIHGRAMTDDQQTSVRFALQAPSLTTKSTEGTKVPQ